MVTRTRAKTQIHMDETILENAELEKLLEERQTLKESVSEYRKADKEAKDAIRLIETPTPYRVGRFVISKKDVPGKPVAFETQDSLRITIKTVGEE